MFVTWFVFYSNMFVYHSVLLNLFLWIFRDFMGFYQSQNTKFSIPKMSCSDFCRSTGPVDRARSRSTELVDRRAQNVHASLAGGPVDRIGQPPESFCSLESPCRPGRSTGRELCSLFLAAVDRAGRPTAVRTADWAVTASFWEPYKLGLSWAVLAKIFGEF